MAMYGSGAGSLWEGMKLGLAANQRKQQIDALDVAAEQRLLNQQRINWMSDMMSQMQAAEGPGDAQKIVEQLAWGQQEFGKFGPMPRTFDPQVYAARSGVGEIPTDYTPVPGADAEAGALPSQSAVMSGPIERMQGPSLEGAPLDEAYVAHPDEELAAERANAAPWERLGYGSKKKYNEALIDEITTEEAIATRGMTPLTLYLEQIGQEHGMNYAEVLRDPEMYATAVSQWSTAAKLAGVEDEQIERWRRISDAIQDNLQSDMELDEARTAAINDQQRQDMNFLLGRFGQMMDLKGQIVDGVMTFTMGGDEKKQAEFNRISAEVPKYIKRGQARGLSLADIFHMMQHDFAGKLTSLPISKQTTVDEIKGIGVADDWVTEYYDYLPNYMWYQWDIEGGRGRLIAHQGGRAWEFTEADAMNYKDLVEKMEAPSRKEEVQDALSKAANEPQAPQMHPSRAEEFVTTAAQAAADQVKWNYQKSPMGRGWQGMADIGQSVADALWGGVKWTFAPRPIQDPGTGAPGRRDGIMSPDSDYIEPDSYARSIFSMRRRSR